MKRTNSLIIAGAILVAAVIISAAVILFFGGNESEPSEKQTAEETYTEKDEETTALSDKTEDGAEQAVEENTAEAAEESATLTLLSVSADVSGLDKADIAATSTTSMLPDKDPWKAFDGDPTTSWQEGALGSGIGESVSCSFDREREVQYLLLCLGNWNGEYYLKNNRPEKVTISMGGNSWSLMFPDSSTPKEVMVEVSPPVTTSSLELRIDSVYRSPDNDDTCIAEVAAYCTKDGLGWQLVGDDWYFYEEKDHPKTGWLDWCGNKYYLQDDGRMMTGFWQITAEKTVAIGNDPNDPNTYGYSGKGYYFLENGQMFVGKIIRYWEAIARLDTPEGQEELKNYAAQIGATYVKLSDEDSEKMPYPLYTMAEAYYVFDENGNYWCETVRSE